MKISKAFAAVGLILVSASFVAADEGDITLRDANTASSIVGLYFPLDNLEVRYTGCVVQPLRAHIDTTGDGYWIVKGNAPDGRTYQIWFELASVALTENDVELHVSIDRVIYVHAQSCWREDIGMVMPDRFDENGIAVADMFRQCDEEAMKQWDFYERVEEVLNEIRQPRRYPATTSPIRAECP